MADDRIKLQNENAQTVAAIVASGATQGEIRNIRCDDDGNLMINMDDTEIVVISGGAPEQFAGNATSGGFYTVAFSGTSTGVLIDNPSLTATLSVRLSGSTSFDLSPESSVGGKFATASVLVRSSEASSPYQIIATVHP